MQDGGNFSGTSPSGIRKHLRVLLPGIVAVVIALVLLFGRSFDSLPILHPSEILPEFELPQLDEDAQLVNRDDLLGRVTLINVWASWCLTCRDEHPLLLQLADAGDIPIVGINYRDKRTDAQRWLQYYTSPYDKIGWDDEGKIAGSFGIDAIPVTLLIDRQGVIRFRHIGPLTNSLIEDKLKPLINELQIEQLVQLI